MPERQRSLRLGMDRWAAHAVAVGGRRERHADRPVEGLCNHELAADRECDCSAEPLVGEEQSAAEVQRLRLAATRPGKGRTDAAAETAAGDVGRTVRLMLAVESQWEQMEGWDTCPHCFRRVVPDGAQTERSTLAVPGAGAEKQEHERMPAVGDAAAKCSCLAADGCRQAGDAQVAHNRTQLRKKADIRMPRPGETSEHQGDGHRAGPPRSACHAWTLGRHASSQPHPDCEPS